MTMSERQAKMCEKLKRLGYGPNSQIKLYGDKYDVTGDPVVITDHLVVVDAVETKSGRARRVRIPLNVLNMAWQEKQTA
jgi:hypothetical protein